MNRIYKSEDREITDANELIYELGFQTNKYKGKIFPGEMRDRITGALCDCNGDGKFLLLPLSHPDVQEGKKRYMVCMKCGCYSHL